MTTATADKTMTGATTRRPFVRYRIVCIQTGDAYLDARPWAVQSSRRTYGGGFGRWLAVPGAYYATREEAEAVCDRMRAEDQRRAS